MNAPEKGHNMYLCSQIFKSSIDSALNNKKIRASELLISGGEMETGRSQTGVRLVTVNCGY